MWISRVLFSSTANQCNAAELFDGGNRYKWTHGILVQVKALRALYFEMVENGPLDYLLTHKQNQDCLENWFSQWRALHGACTKPSQFEAMTRVRNLHFTKNAEFVVKNPSVRIEKREAEEENGTRQVGTTVEEDDFEGFFEFAILGILSKIHRAVRPKGV